MEYLFEYIRNHPKHKEINKKKKERKGKKEKEKKEREASHTSLVANLYEMSPFVGGITKQNSIVCEYTNGNAVYVSKASNKCRTKTILNNEKDTNYIIFIIKD